MKRVSIVLIAALGLNACKPPAEQTQTAGPQGQARFEQLANLPFAQNRPTAETAQTLQDEVPHPAAEPRDAHREALAYALSGKGVGKTILQIAAD